MGSDTMTETEAACGTTPGDEVARAPRRGRDRAAQASSLSPSRASDFKTCPLLYRYRCIDRIPEKPSADAVRGTLVHAVLEQLFDLPAADRTPERALSMIEPAWQRLAVDEPEAPELFGDPAELARWLDSARGLVESYFTLEDPRRLEPAERECLVETTLDDGLTLRGYVDRLDVAPNGAIRVVDYKTGGAPRAAFEAKALFQLKFYALVIWRTKGLVPRQLRLIYLKDRDTLSYSPDEEELRRFAHTVQAIWAAISRSTESGDFRANPGPLCGWCDHQSICPAHGGTPPPYPLAAGASSESEE